MGHFATEITSLPPKLGKQTKAGGTTSLKWKGKLGRIEFQTYVRKDGRKGAGFKYVSDSTGWKGMNCYTLWQILAEIVNDAKAVNALKKYAEADAMIGVERAAAVRRAKDDASIDDEQLATADVSDSDSDDDETTPT